MALDEIGFDADSNEMVSLVSKLRITAESIHVTTEDADAPEEEQKMATAASADGDEVDAEARTRGKSVPLNGSTWTLGSELESQY